MRRKWRRTKGMRKRGEKEKDDEMMEEDAGAAFDDVGSWK